MKKLLTALALVFVLGACAQSDDSRTDIIDLEGRTCAVARDGVGRIIAIDCNWEG